jgi:hypothetical protein
VAILVVGLIVVAVGFEVVEAGVKDVRTRSSAEGGIVWN